MIQEFNRSLLLWFNSLVEYPYIEFFSPVMADLPIFFLPFFLIISWLYYNYKKQDHQKEVLLFLFYSCLLAIIINLSLQQFISLERPENALEGAGKVLLQKLPSASFPSDHAAVSVAFLVSLFLFAYKKTFYSFLPFVILMNLSRVIVWVHWPFDILWGMITGFISSFFSYHILVENKLVKKTNSFIIKTIRIFKL